MRTGIDILSSVVVVALIFSIIVLVGTLLSAFVYTLISERTSERIFRIISFVFLTSIAATIVLSGIVSITLTI